jgi:hypothetical protein
MSIMSSTKGNKEARRNAMMTRIHKTGATRITPDPRINLMGERVDRVWADPILTPRRETAR